MSRNSITKLDGKSVIVGVVFTVGFMLLPGAGKADSTKVDSLQQRFLVLESTSVRDPANGYQFHQLKLCPHYREISQDSLKFRVANETQEVSMIVVVSKGQRFRRGDIISFGSMHRLRLSPGSKITRHLPGG